MSADIRPFSPARLKALREQAGLTQAELAEQASLTVTAVSKMERGLIEPLLSTAARLAAVLGVKCENLLGDGKEAVAEKRRRGRPRKETSSTERK